MEPTRRGRLTTIPGQLMAFMSVRFNFTSSITLPVAVSGVQRCTEWDPSSGEDEDNSGGGIGG
ncbi:MAG: hypothetical protein AAFQ98_24650 [Bacteroidota bacterium]